MTEFHPQPVSAGSALSDGPYGSGRMPDSKLAENDNNFDPIRLFWLVLGYRWLLVAFTLGGLLAGYVYSSMQTPQYRATVNLEILNNNPKSISEFEVIGQSRLERASALENAVFKFRTRKLAQRVVYELGLSEKPEFYLPPQNRFSPKNILRRAFGKTNARTSTTLDAATREARAINVLLKGITVSNKRRTSIITVKFAHGSASFTHQVANQLGKSFISLNVDQTVEASGKVRSFIQQQVVLSKEQLTLSERRLNKYAKSIDFTEFGDEPSLIISRLSSINEALNQTVQERLVLKLVVDQIANGRAISLPDVVNNQVVQVIKSKIAELKVTYQEKLGVYKANFPEMIQRRSQIAELNSQLSQEIRIISDSFFIRLEQVQLKEKSLRQELHRLGAAQQEFREKFVEYTILKREVDGNHANYSSLVVKMNDIGIGSELRSERAVILDLAIQPSTPFSPNKLKITLVALALAWAIVGITIYVLELLKNTFATPDQLDQELNIAILGIIPFHAAADTPREETEDSAAFEEAYRSLRTAIQFSSQNSNCLSLSVTSSEPAEGKSITAFKLAEGFAKLGRKVLLVDADMRRPKLQKWFGLGNTLGLSTFLSGQMTPEEEAESLVQTDIPNLYFLSAGGIPRNAADLLASAQMPKLIHSASKEFDVLIIDSPPVMGLADAPIIARHTSATLFVVAAKQATRKSVSTALKRLQDSGANVVGVTMTKFRLEKYDYNYSYGYMQNNYYTYQQPGAD